MTRPALDDALLGRVARAMFWNAALLPLITLLNLVAAYLLRRTFLLESGVYDVVIGLVAALMIYSGLGLPMTLGQYVPALLRAGGRAAAVPFIRRVYAMRVATLVLAVVALNALAIAWPGAFAGLGEARVYLHLASALLLARGITDLAVKSLQALLQHLTANVVQLLQAAMTVIALLAVLAAGRGIPSFLLVLVAGAFGIALVATLLAVAAIRRLPAHRGEDGASAGPGTARTWRFSLFMYAFDLSGSFATPAFASPALAVVVGGVGAVALFNVAYQMPMMVVVVILAGFQGLYRPMFSAILAEHDPGRLQAAYAEVSKVQALLLIPAGTGLTLMVSEYLPLIFTDTFAPAIPLARALCLFLFLEALLNLGPILLTVAERYRPVLGIQALRILGAIAFVWLAARGQLLAATICFGTGRLAANGLGHWLVHRSYAVRFPWRFAARTAAVAAPMGVVVAAGQAWLPTTPLAALALTAAGVAAFLLGTRALRLLGSREIDLLRRARLPGTSLIIAALAPGQRTEP